MCLQWTQLEHTSQGCCLCRLCCNLMVFQSGVDRAHFETTEKNDFRQTSSGHFYLTPERKKQRPSYVGKLCWCMFFCLNYVSITSRGMHTHHSVYIGLISSFKKSSDGSVLFFFFLNNCKTLWVDIAAFPHWILDDQKQCTTHM